MLGLLAGRHGTQAWKYNNVIIEQEEEFHKGTVHVMVLIHSDGVA